MTYRFIPADIDQIGPLILNKLSAFPSLVDGFLVDHIYDSNHYRIMIDDREAGYCSVHHHALITQFYLDPAWRRFSQQIFALVKKLEQVQTAFVPTCDEYFLAHALDEFRHIEKQAYFFNYEPQSPPIQLDPQFKVRLAKASELDFIKGQSDDFFSDEALPKQLKRNEIWLSYSGEICVGFGLLIKNKLLPDVADLGMYTIEPYRQNGYGKLTIQFLINECLKNNLRITAGCWYYNHNSKKTLESAGMHCDTRLLKISF